jgi:hypothetical protein
MPHRIQNPAEVAQTFRDDCSATGSDVRVLRGEREKAIAVISAFIVSTVYSVHIFVRSGGITLKDASLYIVCFGLGLFSLVGWRRMKRATEALDQLERSHDEKA